MRAIDTDIVIMPNRYLEEIRLLPESKTSGTVASGDVGTFESFDCTPAANMNLAEDAVWKVYGIRADAGE